MSEAKGIDPVWVEEQWTKWSDENDISQVEDISSDVVKKVLRKGFSICIKDDCTRIHFIREVD